ncbi:unnamed protein product [Lactuca virosa]|uniref:Uncharacterized protein n=1 Tax=Lactuca virosa TaxID=75947 RepID=A0AAU9N3G9_9ASTR|nr:unnamed protein product [Lactuca virosa]
MAGENDFEEWDEEFLKEAIKSTEAAVCSSSLNPIQPPPKLFLPPPPPHYAPHISYSPPRELSQRVKEDNHRNFPVMGFDCPVSLNGINRGLTTAPSFPHSSRLHDEEKCSKQQEINQLKVSSPRELSQRVKEDNHRNFPVKGFDSTVSMNGINRGLNSAPPFPHSSLLHDEDKCSKQQEINRLKEELGRVSKVLTNLEQECLELRKDREKNEKHLRSVLPVNGSKDPEALCTNKSNLKNKDPFEDHTIIHPGTKGVIPCKAVGVQTDDDELMIKKSLSVTNHSRKLADIWEPGNDQQPRNNLVSKLFVACGADLQVLFGCLGLNIPSKKTTTKMESFNHDLLDMAPNHHIQSVEAAKVSHLYLTLTKISYDIGRLDDLLEALVTLCHVQNKTIVHRSLCVLHVVLKHIFVMENKGCSRDNVIVNEKHSEVRHLFPDNPHHPVLSSLINAKKVGDSSSFKWFSYYQTMHQIIMTHSEEVIRVEAVSIMNILLLRTDAYKERKMYGEVPVFETISQLLRKEAGVAVQKQTVDLLYLLLNCPSLMLMFCSSCKEEGTSSDIPTTSTETAPAFKGTGAILEGLADCLASRGNGAPKTLVLKLQRNAIIVVAFLASSGRRGFEFLLGRDPCSRRSNFLFLILQVLASEIDVEEASSSSSSKACDDFRER